MNIDAFTLERIKMLDYILANCSLDDVKSIVQQQKTYNTLSGINEVSNGPLYSMINKIDVLETEINSLNEDIKVLIKLLNTMINTPYTYEFNMLKQKRSAY